MKVLGYLMMIAGLVWAALLSSGGEIGGAEGSVALLLGVGFGLLTADAIASGSVRGPQTRIRRDVRPGFFWIIVGVRLAVSLAMIGYAVGIGLGWM